MYDCMDEYDMMADFESQAYQEYIDEQDKRDDYPPAALKWLAGNCDDIPF